jgi:plastocyanin
MFLHRLAAASAIGLAAAASAPSSAQAPAAPVQQILLYSYGYNPNPIVLAAGKPVTLTFVNRAGKGHDFTAAKFFASSRILAGNVSGGEVDLDGGQSKSVTLVPAAGQYKVHCGKPFHKMLGMSGDIVVR